MQIQVFENMAQSAEEIKKRNTGHCIFSGELWLGRQKIGDIEDGDVFNLASHQKFASIANNWLCLINDQTPLVAITRVNGGGRVGEEYENNILYRLRSAAGY